MTGVQKADSAARRRAATVLFVTLGLGLAGISALTAYEPQIQRWLESNAVWLARNAWIVFLAALVAVLPVLAVAAYLYLFGSKIARAARFPPPGQAVVRDTRIVTGGRAVIRGRIVQVLSVCLMLCGLAIPIVLWHLFAMLARAM